MRDSTDWRMDRNEVLDKLKRELDSCRIVANRCNYEPLVKRVDIEASVWEQAIELVE
jgi:hypothetical protein